MFNQCHWDTSRNTDHGLFSCTATKQSGEKLCPTGRILLAFHQDHENIAEAPEQNILEGNPAQNCHKTKDTPDILWVLDIAKRKLRHPRDLLSEPNAIVGTRLTEQLVHPEGKSNIYQQFLFL
jgi:hypothetical protein